MGHMDIEKLLLTLPGVVIGLTVHECMHAYTAFRCGDDTAKESGRISLNPMRHIDPVGLLFIVFAGFGWAKPVMFNASKLRRRGLDTVLIAMAGPFSNAVIALLTSVLFVLTIHAIPYEGNVLYKGLLECMLYAIFINWGLFVFNMIPIPPLDGSHLIFHRLQDNPALYNRLYRYGTMGLFGILIIEGSTKIDIMPISPIIKFLGRGFLELLGYHF
jgi:Zn-dependent protease